jgi:GrpB-like predicted nucleotidyltransferase (UPF0157 family)
MVIDLEAKSPDYLARAFCCYNFRVVHFIFWILPFPVLVSLFPLLPMTPTELKALTKAEWNTLFPVELVAYDPTWPDLFTHEKQRLLAAIGADTLVRIEHFGSSAIAGIQAKPYIDLLVAIAPEQLFSTDLIQQFEALGYAYFKIPQQENIAAYMSFGKGYQRGSERTQIYHLHVCPLSNVMWEQLVFRDYLNTHPFRARQYERLKLGLAAQFRHDRGRTCWARPALLPIRWPWPSNRRACRLSRSQRLPWMPTR